MVSWYSDNEQQEQWLHWQNNFCIDIKAEQRKRRKKSTSWQQWQWWLPWKQWLHWWLQGQLQWQLQGQLQWWLHGQCQECIGNWWKSWHRKTSRNTKHGEAGLVDAGAVALLLATFNCCCVLWSGAAMANVKGESFNEAIIKPWQWQEQVQETPM